MVTPAAAAAPKEWWAKSDDAGPGEEDTMGNSITLLSAIAPTTPAVPRPMLASRAASASAAVDNNVMAERAA